MTTHAATPHAVRPRRTLSRFTRISELVIETAIRGAGMSAIVFVGLIFAFIAKEGLWFLVTHAIGMFSSTDWSPTHEPPTFGILALVAGSLWVVGLSLMISVPLGLAATIYLSEFASVRVREVLKVIIELLAAIPSVVWGFVGVMIVNPILQKMGAQVGLNGLNGAILLGMMSLPLIVSLAEDALRNVPDSYRQAAVAMGATKWEVVWRVLLPAARPGLLVAVLLGVGRCVGETMAVLMATGHSINIPTSLYDPVRTLTATIAAELGEAVRGGEHYQALFALGLLLFGVTFTVNLTADVLIRDRRR
ncbi:MAG: phosphate ABC transporter permease subunit PstC [Myxococcota bacterium]